MRVAGVARITGPVIRNPHEQDDGEEVKLALAARLRRMTTLTEGWIARRLGLGMRKIAAVRLHRWISPHSFAECPRFPFPAVPCVAAPLSMLPRG
jgi:hypothetical protein